MTMEKVTCKVLDLKFTAAGAMKANSIPCLPPSFQSPVDFLRAIVPQECCNGNDTVYFPPTVDEVNAYTMEAVQAIRGNDLTKLRAMLQTGHSLDACNSNGEYLIHLAARRSNLETVQFLLEHADVDVNVRDSMGRTILHDVCWKSSPDTALMNVLLQVISPELLLAQDRRGHSPFDYARKEHWAAWNSFLLERKDLIAERIAFCREQRKQDDDCSCHDSSDYYDSESSDDEMDSDEE